MAWQLLKSMAASIAAGSVIATDFASSVPNYATINAGKLRINSALAAPLTGWMGHVGAPRKSLRAVAKITAGTWATTGGSRAFAIKTGSTSGSAAYLMVQMASADMVASAYLVNAGDPIAGMTYNSVTGAGNGGTNGGAVAINGAVPYICECLVRPKADGTLSNTVTLTIYDGTAGDIGAGATVVSSVIYTYDTEENFGPGAIGLTSFGGNGVHDWSAFDVYEETALTAAYPYFTANRNGTVKLSARYAEGGVGQIVYRVHRQTGFADYAQTNATAVTGYTTSPDFQFDGLAVGSYAFYLETYDGTTSVYSARQDVTVSTAERGAILSHSWGAGTGASVGATKSWPPLTLGLLTSGEIDGVARPTLAFSNYSVGGSGYVQWLPGRGLYANSVQKAIKEGATFAVVLLMTNDGALTGAQIAAYAAKMLTALSAVLPRVLWVTTPATQDGTVLLPATRTAHSTLRDAMAALRGSGVFIRGADLIERFGANCRPAASTNPTPAFNVVAATPGAYGGSWFHDGKHPNDFGHAELAYTIAGYVTEVLAASTASRIEGFAPSGSIIQSTGGSLLTGGKIIEGARAR